MPRFFFPEFRAIPENYREDKSPVLRLILVSCTAVQAVNPNISFVEACQRGDLEAFRTLYESYKDTVYSIALNFSGGNQEAAKDIAQEVFLKLFSSLKSFRGSSNFSTWLFRVVVNACMDEHRRRRRFVPLEESLPADKMMSNQSQERDAWQKQLAGEVRVALEALSPKLRLPIVLRYVQGLSYEEIAHALGCSPGTVASRLNRAHKFLARRLNHLRSAAGGGHV
jgi:RNA polymerase sigma-70 factor, ECF subfamily